MTREEILHTLFDSLDDAQWLLAVLYRDRDKDPINKEKLRDMCNEYYIQATQQEKPLISSRHSLDVLAARLEGAGMVRVTTYGRIRLYSIAPLGVEVLQHRKEQQTI